MLNITGPADLGCSEVNERRGRDARESPERERDFEL